MSDVSFSLAIPHTPWIPERVESFAKLCSGLNLYETDTAHTYVRNEDYWRVGEFFPPGRWCGVKAAKVFAEKASNHVWSAEMWAWGAAQESSHFVTIQDDATVAPDFWRVLHAMVLSKQDEVICLHAVHPAARAIAGEGYPWFTTSDGMVGVAYVLPQRLLQEFLTWRSALPAGAVEAITEDTLLGLWCMVTGRKVYHPVPTIVDHDTSIPSTYGNDAHLNRRPPARWDTVAIAPDALTSTSHWLSRPHIPHMGRFFDLTPLAVRWCGADATAVRRFMGDNGAAEARRLNYARKARGQTPKVRLFVGTPTRGDVHGEYAASMWRLLRHEDVELEDPLEVVDVQQWMSDVVRVRSRFVQHFLTQTDATHLLFVDADISFAVNAVTGMLRADKDFVACPYPRRDTIDWQRVRDITNLPPEAMAYRYCVQFLDSEMMLNEKDACAEVKSVPLGMALLKREMLERMCAEYDNLSFLDEIAGGKRIPGVALFQLLMTPEGGLLSEDYSFCRRWRDMGGKIHLYLGPGSPVNHWGQWGFRGHVEAFGLARK